MPQILAEPILQVDQVMDIDAVFVFEQYFDQLSIRREEVLLLGLDRSGIQLDLVLLPGASLRILAQFTEHQARILF